MVSYTSSYLLILSWKSFRACNNSPRLQSQVSSGHLHINPCTGFMEPQLSPDYTQHISGRRRAPLDPVCTTAPIAPPAPRASKQLCALTTLLRRTGTQRGHLLFGGGPVVLGQDVRVVADALNEEVLPLPMVPVPLQGRP